jgi:hypothetical protein
MGKIPQSVVMVASDVLKNRYSENDLVGIFAGLGVGNAREPAGNKRALCMQCLGWLNSSRVDALATLGDVLGELMDEDSDPDYDVERDRIRAALSTHGLRYERGGRIVLEGAALAPDALEELISERNMPGLEREFRRALDNVESDTSTAVTAACSSLESFFKYYIGAKGLDMPSDQSIAPLWRVVRNDLALTPERITNEDLRRIVQGMASMIDGVGALRSHAAAHGEGPATVRLEPRHARLAVHASHATLLFLFETWALAERTASVERS